MPSILNSLNLNYEDRRNNELTFTVICIFHIKHIQNRFLCIFFYINNHCFICLAMGEIYEIVII